MLPVGLFLGTVKGGHRLERVPQGRGGKESLIGEPAIGKGTDGFLPLRRKGSQRMDVRRIIASVVSTVMFKHTRHGGIHAGKIP